MVSNQDFGESWNCNPVCAVVHSYIFQGGVLILSCELPPTHTCWSSKCHRGESWNSRREIQQRRDHTDVIGCTCKERTPAMSQNNLWINYFKPANYQLTNIDQMRGKTVNVLELRPQSLHLHGRLIRIKMPHVTTWQKELQQWGNFFVEDLIRFEDRRTPRWFAGQVIDPVFHSVFLFYWFNLLNSYI